jgi:hypothetical protein
MAFLMVDGEGNPDTSLAYKESIAILYGVSYTLKFALKKEKHIDYQVMPLEGLWHVDVARLEKPREWRWTSMIMQPDFVTRDVVEKAVDQLEKRKNPAGLRKIRFERFDEGLSAQIMHIGPYSSEELTIQKLHEFIAEKGFRTRGDHHEIYLGDPRRAIPSRLRTILRQPVTQSKC